MRKLLTLSVVMAALLAAAGCGSSGGSSVSKADREAVVSQVMEGNVVTRAQATCIANAAIAAINSTSLSTVTKRSAGPPI